MTESIRTTAATRADATIPSPRPIAGFSAIRRRRHESRPLDRLRAHYVVETQLARRLMNASKTERLSAYKLVYDELFAKVPDHPQHTRRQREDRSHIEIQ